MENMATDVMCGDFFDHIDDLLDFPNDDDRDYKAMAMAMGGMMMPMETPAAEPYIHSDCGGLLPPPPPPPPPPTAFPSPPTAAAAAFDQKGDQLFDDLDIADLEWVSNFMDDSAGSFTLPDFPAAAEHNKESLFRTPSPVSVLESNSHSGGGSGSSSTSSSSSSSSSSNFCYPAGNGGRSLPRFSSVVPGRARSKRPRPAAMAHVTTPFLPTSPPEPESFGEAVKKKKAKKNKNPLALAVSGEEAWVPQPQAQAQAQVRKCMHCEIQKTPQWRAGPMGPKTLCNACGVRYKSGRLFPEYRPAASPTFVPSLHSNSHKKVVEMRINATAPNSCDLLDYIRRRE